MLFFALGPNWSIVILYAMLGTQYFYFTGHQTTIPAIRFEAAFVGLPGDLDNLVLPGESFNNTTNLSS